MLKPLNNAVLPQGMLACAHGELTHAAQTANGFAKASVAQLPHGVCRAEPGSGVQGTTSADGGLADSTAIAHPLTEGLRPEAVAPAAASPPASAEPATVPADSVGVPDMMPAATPGACHMRNEMARVASNIEKI